MNVYLIKPQVMFAYSAKFAKQNTYHRAQKSRRAPVSVCAPRRSRAVLRMQRRDLHRELAPHAAVAT